MKFKGSCHCGKVAFELEGELKGAMACGIHPYREGTDPKGNRMAAINIRCLEGIDLAAIPVQHFGGRAL